MNTPASKICPACGLSKPASEWHKNAARYDGLATRCKQCHARAYGARHAAKHSERVRYARAMAVEVYGGECVRCASPSDLEFDHANGDGGVHRSAEHVQRMYERIWKTGRLTDVELQLLCRPCHRAKTRENGEYRRTLRIDNQCSV